MINFAAFLGWASPQGQREVYGSLSDMARDFSLDVRRLKACLHWIQTQGLAGVFPTDHVSWTCVKTRPTRVKC